MKIFIAAAFLFLTVTSADDDFEWQQYKATYDIKLFGLDEAVAKQNFLKALKRVADSKQSGYTRSNSLHIGQQINEISHIDPHQFMQGALGYTELPQTNSKLRQIPTYAGSKPVTFNYTTIPYTLPTNLPNPLPLNFDWRNYPNVVQQQVGYQWPCGCCYVFAGIAVLEGQLTIRYNRPANLSQEYVRDCVFTSTFSSTVKSGCDGGVPLNVWQFAGATGLLTKENYPYHNDNVSYTCPVVPTGSNLVSINVTGLASSKPTNATLMQQILMAVGPLPITLDVSELGGDTWYNWDGKNPAVYPATNCSKTGINHAVTLVGWGEDSINGQYWIMKNSWGRTWADHGYFKIPRGINACACELSVYWPCIDGTCFPPSNPALSTTGTTPSGG